MKWDTIMLNRSKPDYTFTKVKILNGSDNKPIPGVPKIKNQGEFDISYIDPVKYPSIKLKASLVTESCKHTPVLHYWGASWKASNAWRDTFFEGERVVNSKNLEAENGNISIKSSVSYINGGILNSTTQTCPLNNSWHTLIINKSEPANTSIKVTIIDNLSGLPITGYQDLTGPTIYLNGIDPSVYPSIRMTAAFGSTDRMVRPTLSDWSFNWTYKNLLPIADAGSDKTLFENQLVILNGTGSTDPDGSIVNWSWDIDADGIFDLFGPTAWYTYNDDSMNNVTLMVTDDQDATDTDWAIITVLNINSTINNVTVSILNAAPRTIGYWKHQCKIDSPKGDHTGILPEFISGVNANSSVFNNLSSKNDILDYLEPEDHSNMTEKAKQQLMALWLNVVSGKLGMNTSLNLTGLTNATTVGAAIAEIEQIILNASSNRTEMERAKDIADYINNGNGVMVGNGTTLFLSLSDSGSDDIHLTIDWNDGSANTTSVFFNNSPTNTPDLFPSQFNGTAPFNISTTVTHAYSSPGIYLITIMIHDDDFGTDSLTLSVTI
jgi:hypothetical protein